MQSDRIRNKILIPLAVTLLLLLVFGIYAVRYERDFHIKRDAEEGVNAIETLFRNQLEQDADKLRVAFDSIKDSKRLREAFQTGDKKVLYDYCRPAFLEMRTRFGITHWYFHTPEGVNYLRVHNYEKSGDQVKRFTMLDALESGRRSIGIEIGKYGTFTLRVVSPWYDGDKLLGYIEFGEEIEHITQRLKDITGDNLYIFIDKQYEDRAGWEAGLKVFGKTGSWDDYENWVLIDYTDNLSLLPGDVTANLLPSGAQTKQVHRTEYEGKTYSVGIVPLIDAGQREVGVIVITKDISDETATYNSSIIIIASVFCLVIAGLIGFYYFVLGNMERAISEQMHLKSSEERLRRVAKGAGNWIWEIDADGLLTFSSPAVKAILGYQADNVVGKKYLDFLQPGQAAEIEQDIKYHKTVARKEIQAVDTNGNKVIMESNYEPIINERGMFLGYRGSNSDISHLKRIEDELRDERKSLQDYMNAMTTASIKIALDGTVLATNTAAVSSLGASVDGCDGEKIWEMPAFNGNENVRKKVTDAFKRASAGEAVDINDRIMSKGNEVFLSMTFVPVMSADGSVRYVIAESRNVTDLIEARESAEAASQEIKRKLQELQSSRTAMLNIMEDMEKTKDEAEKARTETEWTNRQLEETLARVNEMAEAAEAASRAKSEFLANMSHEIRTPMNGIMGMLELARDTEDLGEIEEYLETAQECTDSLMRIINDILDFSKIEAGKMELEVIDFDLRAAVEGALDTLTKPAEDKGLEVACLIHHDVPTALRGDPGRLRQVLVNLLGNAVKFTEKGEISVEVKLEFQEDTRAIVYFAVTDTGIGIPAEHRHNIFGQFTQVDGSTTRKYGGTGLGLAISRQLIEAMDGEISVESEVGKGSTFFFTAAFELQEAAAQSEWEEPEVNGIHVLVVDDNATNRRVITKMLEAFGCQPCAVESGEEALEAVKQAAHDGDPFRLILLDKRMPGMDGIKTAEKLKGDPETSDPEIIILTSAGERGDITRFDSIGCAGYLIKPVKQANLFDIILAVLGTSKDDKTHHTPIITRDTAMFHRKSVNILLVEDNPVNQKLAVKIIEKAGYNSVVANNGQEALDALAAKDYDLVLMDVQMPIMNGMEATKAIREREGAERHTPIIAMTAHAMDGDKEKCLASGMDDYLSKPLKRQEMERMMEQWLEGAVERYAAEAKADADNNQHQETAIKDEETNEQKDFGEELPINVEDALERACGDKELLLSLIESFLEYMPEILGTLKDAQRVGDIEKIVQSAHSIKGAALNLSADKTASIALEIEHNGQQGDISEAAELVAQLENEIGRIKDKLIMIQEEVSQ